MGRRARALACLVTCTALPAAARASGESDALDVVYVEANVGTAGGGHAALRIGELVYHVQTDVDGLFYVVRDDWPTFEFEYAGLQNRPLHVGRLSLPPPDLERVRSHLADWYVAQARDRAAGRVLRDDVAWLEAWSGAGRSRPRLRTAGLLDPTRAGDAEALALRVSVAAARGERFLADALAETEAALAHQTLSEPGALEAHRDRLALREALRALDAGWGLDPAALLDPAPRAPLAPDEREAVERLAERFVREVVWLLGSPRADRGFPLHVAIARWLAARRSLAEGRLRVLDPFPDADAPGELPRDTTPRGRASLEADAARAFDAARASTLRAAREAATSGRSLDESALSLLEEAAGRLHEVRRGGEGEPVRQVAARLVPSRGREVESAQPAGDPAAALAAAQEALAAHEAAFRERWSYHPVYRNCITELARALRAAYPDEAATRAAFGGPIEPGGDLGFIPFVFFSQVRDDLRVAAVERIPSYRERRLAALAHEAGLLARLREGNTLTSAIYAHRLRDGAFLFFTQGAGPLRPLLGIANLAWAVAHLPFALLAAPFDAGARLAAAGSGALWSVPELVFVNVRKGSFEWVELPPAALSP